MSSNSVSIANQGNTSINILPKDLLGEIFGYLRPKDIYGCMRVCRKWKRATESDKVWIDSLIHNNRTNILDDFHPLVINRVLTWKEAVRLSPLSDFFAKIFCWEEKESIIISRNKELENRIEPHYHNIFIRHGNLTFMVINSSDVEIKANGKEKLILEGKQGVRLIDLAVVGKFLFALRTDGVIVQWDYKNNEIVQEIQTAYAKGDHQLDYLNQTMEHFRQNHGIEGSVGRFEVNENFILLIYRGSICEIINYTNANDSFFISKPCTKLLFKHDKVFDCEIPPAFTYTFYLVTTVVDLTTKRERSFKCKAPYFEIGFHCYNIDFEKNVICFSPKYSYMQQGEIFFLDPRTGKELKRINHKSRCGYWEASIIIGNLFIGKNNSTTTIIDLNTGEIVGDIKALLDCENNTLSTTEIAKLITICKDNLTELKLPEKKPRSNCIIA